MVFPSLIFQNDMGMAAQLSAWTVILFSFFIYRFKKILVILLIVLFSCFFVSSQLHAFMVMPTNNRTQCMSISHCGNNFNYYGPAYGAVPPVYFYPQLPYHSFNPYPTYFMPHTPSPYQSFDCPFCGPQYAPQRTMPMFPQYPMGVGAS